MSIYALLAATISGVAYYLYPQQFPLFFYNEDHFIVGTMAAVGGSLVINAFFAFIGGVTKVRFPALVVIYMSIMEEPVHRLAAILVANYLVQQTINSTEVTFSLFVVGVISGFIFMVIHDGIYIKLNRWALGTLFFFVAWYAGLVPAMIGHLFANACIAVLGHSSDE